MPSLPDLTPEEIAAVLEARRKNAVEDSLPPSFTARLDREVAARVDAELAARGAGSQGSPAVVHVVGKREKSGDGSWKVGVASLFAGIPMMGIVEGTSHGNLLGAAVVMGGVALVNFAHAIGRRRS